MYIILLLIPLISKISAQINIITSINSYYNLPAIENHFDNPNVNKIYIFDTGKINLSNDKIITINRKMTFARAFDIAPANEINVILRPYMTINYISSGYFKLLKKPEFRNVFITDTNINMLAFIGPVNYIYMDYNFDIPDYHKLILSEMKAINYGQFNLEHFIKLSYLPSYNMWNEVPPCKPSKDLLYSEICWNDEEE